MSQCFLPEYMQRHNRVNLPSWRPTEGQLRVAIGAPEDIKKIRCSPEGPYHLAFITPITFHPVTTSDVVFINPATGAQLL